GARAGQAAAAADDGPTDVRAGALDPARGGKKMRRPSRRSGRAVLLVSLLLSCFAAFLLCFSASGRRSPLPAGVLRLRPAFSASGAQVPAEASCGSQPVLLRLAAGFRRPSGGARLLCARSLGARSAGAADIRVRPNGRE